MAENKISRDRLQRKSALGKSQRTEYSLPGALCARSPSSTAGAGIARSQ
jgi:hypothetical protein